ncbi:MAG TPA: hypothetical protein VHT96_12845 [Clostridia bacterium]|nr:hypothetical protein [Clostridia bacterium]
MDEFRKPFDYFEEQGIGGILLVLFFMLITVEPLVGVFGIYFGFDSMSVYGFLGVVFQAAAIIYTVFSVFSGVALKKMLGFVIRAIKIFLVYRVFFLIPLLYFNMVVRIEAIPYEKGHALYENMHAQIISSFVVSVAYTLLFSVLWYIYLLRSRNVRETFSRQVKEGSAEAR